MKKYALVTGSSGGIGQAISKTLSKQGFVVFLHYFQNEKLVKSLDSQIKKGGGESYLIKIDLNNPEEIKKMFEQIRKITERIDVLVNNAGIYFPYLIEDYPLENIIKIMNVNFTAIFLITQLALPFLKKADSPSIINISSRLGKEKVVDKSSAYSASKAALIQFTKSCALEFRKYNIRANCVCPGFTRTDMNKKTLEQPKLIKKMEENIPSGRIGETQDIANMVSFLASNNANYINGESIGVNGGSVLV